MDISNSNNNRVAKNTLFLYTRMLLAMGISLYTSRVVLSQLGVTDFGIYNVIGGIVALFGVLNSAMAGSTQRYLTFELGRNTSDRMNLIFNTSFQIHLLIAIIITILAEIAGNWLIDTQMQIPLDKRGAAFWVFQFSILSMIVSFINVPYMALIIAHEKMDVFAYISLFEILLKLAIAFLLSISPIDKLIFYSFLSFLSYIVIRFIYWIYTNRYLDSSKLKMVFSFSLFKEMSVFAGWGLFGQLAGMFSTQGVNILLNIFFGPAVNAARGIAVQVQAAVSQFSMNFQTAINPQITKSYAVQDFVQMHSLICRSAKFSFFLLFALALPIMIEAPQILSLWLTEVPEYTVMFLRIILWVTIVDSMANPLMIAASANGNIKRYQLVVGGFLLVILPIAYFALKLGAPPETVFIIHLLICILAFIVRLYIVQPLVYLSPRFFLAKVVLRCVYTAIIASIMPLLIYFCTDSTIVRFIIVIISGLLSVCIFSYYLGLDKNEQLFLRKLGNALMDRLNYDKN